MTVRIEPSWKQHLHADELPYFVAGNGQVTLAAGRTSRVKRFRIED